ncbi:MAG: class I SAM-dependent methyltransferase [Sedimentisphaerales bacterium]|nr:class I SAM-dependent methyltransferase [Sedimentisphaerales bacterium]MBN2843560.1 class I SAM-dependent methyltransferase [Sedimentisphaerales bacterium]
MSRPNNCPLCLRGGHISDMSATGERHFYFCGNCYLIFADPEDYLPLTEQKNVYDQHENHIADDGYVAFLERLLGPMSQYLQKGMSGLDFGCGPGPVISQLLERKGILCDNYDPIYYDCVLAGPYDFITATECFEHFTRPAAEIARISQLIPTGGILGIMTELWQTPEQFRSWYYLKDPTHIVFYHKQTIEYIVGHFCLELLWTDAKRVVILRKK